MNKNGWQYAVWGSSADPSTWYEQNITLLNQGHQPPQRQLQRREVTKLEREVIEQRQRSEDLTNRTALRIQ